MSSHTNGGLVDFHSHFVTEGYIQAAKQFGHERPDNMPGWPTWSQEEHLELMDANGIQRALISISSPGVYFGDEDAAADLAREVNNEGLATSRRLPERFGLFASLPLPNVSAAIAEAKRTLDAGAAGVSVMSNAGGVYLGDSRYERLWEELDRRQAIVFIHPTAPPNAEAVTLGRPLPMIEFVFDEARTFADLVFAGVLLRYPGIRFIISHSGGALPLLTERMELFRGRAMGIGSGDPSESTRIQLGRAWFDCAGTPFPTALPVLASVVGNDHLVFGSDYCFTRPHLVAGHMQTISENAPLPDDSSWLDLFERNGSELLAPTAAAAHA